MKIKQVCDSTGLSERTIRFYIEKGLIAPQSCQQNQRTYYEFGEDDVRQTEQIAILRKIGFSIAEILSMKNEPECIGFIIEEHLVSLEESARKQAEALKAVQNAAGSQYPSLSVLCAVFTESAEHLELPQRDVWPNFAQFDEETPEEREKSYQSFLDRQNRKEQRLKWLKPVLLSLCAAALIFGVVIVVSYIPRHIQRDFLGSELEMSGEGSKLLKKIDIHIEGWLYGGLFTTPSFKGLFELSTYPYTYGTQVEIPLAHDNVEVCPIVYASVKDGIPHTTSLGMLYTDSNFRTVAIHLFDMKINDDGSRSGLTGNRVIAAPASDLEMASSVLHERNIYWMDFKGVIHYPR